ncbi:MAG: hypothetical protein RIG63_19545 [Coleofasciculus chthonoplastes F3-SA18-01]|uniref:hypothetical protein n=1 Tax=Coleofasciculus chthonoplastes TaxID=64178 RepID=UPI0032FE98AF
MSTPIVIFHVGYIDYLELALTTAKKYNNDVLLIGDESNKMVWNFHLIKDELTSTAYQDFLKVYTQMSSYNAEYDLLIFERFFCLREWMKRNNIHEAWMLDSDVISFSNFTKKCSKFIQNSMAAISIPQHQEKDYRWAAFGHNSYWTLAGITSFTDFCIETYSKKISLLQEKYEWHVKNNVLGGVCEMTLLYLWAKGKTDVFNTAQVYDGMTIDNWITSSENFDLNEYPVTIGGIKHITFKDGIPYSFNKKLGKNVAFLSLHCQGSAKKYMRFFANDSLMDFYQLAPVWELMRPQRVRNKIKKLIKKL